MIRVTVDGKVIAYLRDFELKKPEPVVAYELPELPAHKTEYPELPVEPERE